MRNQTIVVDINKEICRILKYKQYDNNNLLQIIVEENYKKINLESYSGFALFQLPSGMIIEKDCEIQENVISVTIDNNILSEDGTVALDLTLSDGEKTFTLFRIVLTIEKTIDRDEAIIIDAGWDIVAEIVKFRKEEVQRQADEAQRLAKEEQRLKEEVDRQDEEIKRKANETQRLINEEQRISKENKRLTDEELRTINENKRLEKEEQRLNDEQKRISAEEIRLRKEIERLQNETDRNNSEMLRAERELERIEQERQRLINEEVRESNEKKRQELLKETDVDKLINTSIRLDNVENELMEVNSQLAHVEKKINNGIVYIKDFNSELLDDDAIIQNAFNFAKNNFESYTIVFESRDYEVSQSIAILSGKNVTINGNNANIHLKQNPDTKWYVFIDIPKSANMISFNCFGLNIDGEQYGVHYNDRQGLFVFYVHASRVNINNCNLTNIYGSGINACGMVDIHDNYFYNCSGQNYGEHPSGSYDNYGDAIRISDEISKVGKVYNNYIVLDSDRRGRAGIVLEFDTSNIEVSYNYISGYDRGIHVELVENSIVRENTITNTDTGILLAGAPFTRVQGNKIYNLYENTNDSYKNACIYFNNDFADSDICDNYLIGGSIADAIKIGAGEGVRFRNNIICGKIALSNSNNVIFIGNTLNNSNVDNKNIMYAYNSNNITLENNIINNYGISFASGSKHTLLNNTFNSDGVEVLIQLSNTSLYRINYNRFDVTGITTLIFSYQPKQVGEFSGNIVYSDDSINVFTYSYASAHQSHITKNDNIQIKSDNTIIKLDETYKVNNIFYGETLILHDANNVKYKVIVNTDGTVQSQKI